MKYLQTTKENTYLKVELYYDLGGMNYFTGKPTERGYYLMVTPIVKQGYCEITTAFSGVKYSVFECSRKSAKNESAALQRAAEYESDLINYVLNKNDLTLI